MMKKISKLTGLILVLAMCFSALVEGTVAWFTDSVSSENNRIKAGSLDVELLLDSGKNGSYAEIGQKEGDIFSEAAGNSILWEPGKTEIVFLAVENAGDLALRYDFCLNIMDDGLAGALRYAVVPGMTAEAFTEKSIADWSGILALDNAATGALQENTFAVINRVSLAAGKTDYLMLAVHIDEMAGNAYMNKSVQIDVCVAATQDTVEQDSFDNQYDDDAYVDFVSGDIRVISGSSDIQVSSLKEAAESADDGDIIRISGRITPTAGITVSGKSLTVEGRSAYIDTTELAGSLFTVDADAALALQNLNIFGGAKGFAVDYDAVTFTNFTIPLVSGSADSDTKRSAPLIASEGTLTIDSVTVRDHYTTGNGAALTIKGGSAVIRSSQPLQQWRRGLHRSKIYPGGFPCRQYPL